MIRAIDIMPEPVKGKARNAYEELILEGMEKGEVKGIEKGELKKIKEGSINLFKNGVPIDIIAKSFEISEADVKQILTDAGINL